MTKQPTQPTLPKYLLTRALLNHWDLTDKCSPVAARATDVLVDVLQARGHDIGL